MQQKQKQTNKRGGGWYCSSALIRVGWGLRPILCKSVMYSVPSFVSLSVTFFLLLLLLYKFLLQHYDFAYMVWSE